MTAFYNEIDPYAAQWLRNLIAAGHIAPGVVDERSIEDIKPHELSGYSQCHFFAGLGGWSYALRLAGCPDDLPVWTGSCPCQPFSTAGKGTGFADERHLWPAFHHLIRECRPAVVFGEQVASKDGLGWFDLVQADLEGEGYAIAAVDLCAAGVGAPHIRQRLYWVANADNKGLEGREQPGRKCGVERTAGPSGVAGGLADADFAGERMVGVGSVCVDSRGAGNAWVGFGGGCGNDRPSQINGHWRDADWLHCRDGKWRPVEPGTFPLAHGVSNRMGRQRAYGNAIVPQVAAAFVITYFSGTSIASKN